MQLMIELSGHARRYGARTAIESGDQKITYAELPAHVDDYVEELLKAGCSRLAIAGDNSIDWLLWDLAALKAGIPCVPLPPFFTPVQREHVLQAAGITHIAHNAKLQATGIAILPPLPMGTDKITFTSGSTGTPKGVCLAQAGIEQVTSSIAARLGDGLAGRHLCVLPLSILLENVAGVYTALMMGATVVVPPLASLGMANAFQPDFTRLLSEINRLQATTIILVPELLRGLVGAIDATRQCPEKLAFAAVGGARVAPELLVAARALGLPVYEGYGLSECASVVSLNTPDDDRIGTAGRILDHIDMATENGELVVRNATFRGYLGEAARAESTFKTGDLGVVSNDGRIEISGRSKNIIITGFGRNISPEWVESYLLAQPGILQAVAYGDGAQALSALIVPRKSDADIKAAITAANAHLPLYAQVADFKIVAPFTTTNNMLTGNGRVRRDVILHTYTKEKTMTFYDRLQKETQAARTELYSVPQLTDGLSGRISRDTYIAYLTEAFHHVKHTVRFMMAMGLALPDSKKWLHDAISEYIEEEKGHEEWILNDIAAAGGDKEKARAATPNLETQVLVAYNYDYIARKNPVGFLGMVFMLESTSTQIASTGADAIMAGLGLPKSAFSYLYSHGALDVEHLKFFETLVNQITDPADQAAIIEVANNTFRLFANVLRAIPHTGAVRHAA